MKLETTKTSYALELTIKQFAKVIDKDDKNPNVSGCLFDVLSSFGCLDVNYDGHFGPWIFFSLSIEDDHKKQEIVEIVKTYIK